MCRQTGSLRNPGRREARPASPSVLSSGDVPVGCPWPIKYKEASSGLGTGKGSSHVTHHPAVKVRLCGTAWGTGTPGGIM